MIRRLLLATVAVATLVMVYLFQQVDVASRLLGGGLHPNMIFVINKTLRMVINDVACMVLIFAIFQQSKYLRVAFYVFLFELVVVLPLYFAVKLTLEGDSELSSPWLSAVHRLIVNPMLMLLLMAGFFYQRYRQPSGRA